MSAPAPTQIRVLVKEPGKPPEERFLTPEPADTGSLLRPLQHIVGGRIEMIRFIGSPLAFYCNEDGRMKGLAPNFVKPQPGRYRSRPILGTVVFFCEDARRKSGMRSLTAGQVETIQRFLEEWNIEGGPTVAPA